MTTAWEVISVWLAMANNANRHNLTMTLVDNPTLLAVVVVTNRQQHSLQLNSKFDSLQFLCPWAGNVSSRLSPNGVDTSGTDPSLHFLAPDSFPFVRKTVFFVPFVVAPDT